MILEIMRQRPLHFGIVTPTFSSRQVVDTLYFTLIHGPDPNALNAIASFITHSICTTTIPDNKINIYNCM